MKRLNVILLVSLLILTTVLSGCTQNTKDKEMRLSVVCTVFPQYDWVRQILGDKADGVELTLLLANRIDLHSFQPSVDDIVKISGCDLFIYVGGESDGWVGGALGEAQNKNMIMINLLDALGDAAKLEESIEGMEEDSQNHDHYDDHDHDEGHRADDGEEGHAHEAEYDEHVWLSLKNAKTFCALIADALSSLDANNAGAYQNNLASYTEKLSALDAEYQTVVDAARVKTVLFADRFPFRYLVDEYGISYYAAFAGCSAETEASFATIVFLAQKMDELQLPCVMVTESSDQSIARTIIQNTKARDYKINVLDAMQSVSSNDVRNGTTYLFIMEGNLEVLKDALR